MGHSTYARTLAALTPAVRGHVESSCLIGAVVDGLALGTLRHGVLALTRAVSLGLFERTGLCRVHRIAFSHFIRRSRLVSELWRARARGEDRCQHCCRHYRAEEGKPLRARAPPWFSAFAWPIEGHRIISSCRWREHARRCRCCRRRLGNARPGRVPEVAESRGCRPQLAAETTGSRCDCREVS
jgi:hypothetical protein